MHRFMTWITEHSVFDSVILLAIFANVLTIALEASINQSNTSVKVMAAADLVFLVIYCAEATCKIYCQPRGYFANSYNRFDFIILCSSFLQYQSFINFNITFLRVFRALRALRALRSVSFIRSLQVLVNALLSTLSSTASLIFLLLLIMYIFAIIAFYLFGHLAVDDWGTVGRGMYSLFVFVTTEGWANYQYRLDETVGRASRIFSVGFIFIGNMIFTNLFIGVVIQNLESAREEEANIQLVRRAVLTDGKKRYLAANQEGAMCRMLENMGELPLPADRLAAMMVNGKTRSPDEVVQNITSTHDEVMWVTHRSCSLRWIETYLRNLELYEHANYRLQQLHFDAANALASMVEMHLEKFDDEAARRDARLGTTWDDEWE
jgi:cation channel sperm-associated protein 3